MSKILVPSKKSNSESSKWDDLDLDGLGDPSKRVRTSRGRQSGTSYPRAVIVGRKPPDTARRLPARPAVVRRATRCVVVHHNSGSPSAQAPVSSKLISQEVVKPDAVPIKTKNVVSVPKPPVHSQKPSEQSSQQGGRAHETLSLATFHPDELLLPGEVAAILGMSVNTLGNWRWRGTGPQYIKVGGAVRYQVAALNMYVERGRRTSTSITRVGKGLDHE